MSESIQEVSALEQLQSNTKQSIRLPLEVFNSKPDSSSKLYSALVSEGALQIQVPSLSEDEFKKLRRSLLFSGFVNINRTDSEVSASKPKTTEATPLESKNQTIDEDELLAEEEEYKNLGNPEDCLTKPKPCKNCSCGRADELNKPEVKKEPGSSCGRCNLGDAYRCAGCPYRGYPAFTPGEEPAIEVGGGLSEQGAKVVGGKVTLDL